MSGAPVFESMTLTSDDVKALKNADEAIVFRYDASNNTATIEASKKLDPGDGYGAQTVTRTIAVTPGSQTVYGSKSDGPHSEMMVSASWVFLSPRFGRALRTFLDSLRSGDEVRMQFVANNNNDNLRNAGLTADEVHVEIVRGVPGPNQKRLHFLLGYTIYPPDSLGRNIKLETWSMERLV
jgi:hypothetical protein